MIIHKKTTLEQKVTALAEAARDDRRVSGWTHDFYRYPARFSPSFAAAAIRQFSEFGDVVADPYMGGGTTVVEAAVAGREVVGNDLNSLAAFIARVKTTPLSVSETLALLSWRARINEFSYRSTDGRVASVIDDSKTRNLNIPRARFIKKVVAAALTTIDTLPTENSQAFARCAVLRVSQWALDGRRKHTTLVEFRDKLSATVLSMVEAIRAYSEHVNATPSARTILNIDAAALANADVFENGKKADLVVTSPPYPGVHMLYHRWQVDGRRETPAPYWIAGCNDGKGASYYNFADRRQGSSERYFARSLATLKGIRSIMKDGGYLVQLVAFNKPEEQLGLYAANMAEAGFEELVVSGGERIWRKVPNRKWHATLRGQTHSSNEVVFIHRAC